MRFIDLSKIDPNDPGIKSWIKVAQGHLSKLSKCSTHDDRKNYLEKHSYWNKLKDELKNLFGKKCWYSECAIEGEPGDVDHFRPKNKSTDEKGNVILSDGYWWLAYDYKNYRLSCENCNRSYHSGGKNDCFPLKKGATPAMNPNSNDEYILLDPCNSNDCTLIDCDDSGAIVAMTSDTDEINRVNVSRDVYNLQEFNTARQAIRSNCKMILERYEMHFNNDSTSEFQYDFESIKCLIKSDVPYSSFARKYIQTKIVGKPYEQVISSILQKVV